VAASTEEPWRKAFRWKIPHLPAGDAVEFTFRAVDPSSEKYEAALYHSDGVVLERVVGEPRPKAPLTNKIAFGAVMTAMAAFLFFVLTGRLKMRETSGEKLTAIKLAGCDLRMISFFDVYGRGFYSPFQVKHRLFNEGHQNCVIRSDELNLTIPTNIKLGEIIEKEQVSESYPILRDSEISVGSSNTSLVTTTVPLYLESQ
jgi:hypothetical protein